MSRFFTNAKKFYTLPLLLLLFLLFVGNSSLLVVAATRDTSTFNKVKQELWYGGVDALSSRSLGDEVMAKALGEDVYAEVINTYRKSASTAKAASAGSNKPTVELPIELKYIME
ncbi:MAG: hypothetical protein HQK50_10510 [Oligoflexia bacterium]|nr:hypothetical protein [Oligoflexia bacterium]MBF0365992.1 hypothetical protein [Oligoflexia bacterium]